MIIAIIPKLPMRIKAITKQYYINQLGFSVKGSDDFNEYLMLEKDNIEIHFFLFEALIPSENYGQIYIRVNHIDDFYKTLLENKTAIHPNADLQIKPWGQKEFALLDPDNNLLTFGQSI